MANGKINGNSLSRAIACAGRTLSMLSISALPLLMSASIFAEPDQVWINGDVRTSNPKMPRAQAFAIEDGKFTAVGSDEDVKALAGSSTKIQNLNGKTVIPGVIDNHFHLSSWLLFGNGVNLMDTGDKSVWIERIKARADETPKGELVYGGGWRLSGADQLPTAEELDAISQEHPIMIVDGDHHNLWVNSKFLADYHITADTPNPPGGEIVKDKETGKPTGILKESAAFNTLVAAIESLPLEKRQAVWREAIAYVNSLGITGMHNMGFAPESLELISLVEKKQFALRMWFGAFVNSAEDVEMILPLYESVNKRAKPYETEGPRFQFGYVKTLADGVVSTHTAALTKDYADRPGHKGHLVVPQATLEGTIARANLAGIPVAVHAIGDEAVSKTLDAFSASPKLPSLMNRIEHAELIGDQELSRFASLNVAASMQPYHAVSGSIYYEERVGKQRHQEAWPWSKVLDSGTMLTFGSDWPTDEGSPLIVLHAAVSAHKKRAISLDRALYAMTQETANLSGWGDQLGSVTVGKWADFVILDGTLLDKELEKSLLELKVSETYIAGDSVFGRE